MTKDVPVNKIAMSSRKLIKDMMRVIIAAVCTAVIVAESSTIHILFERLRKRFRPVRPEISDEASEASELTGRLGYCL
jgi:hypothetical protein